MMKCHKHFLKLDKKYSDNMLLQTFKKTIPLIYDAFIRLKHVADLLKIEIFNALRFKSGSPLKYEQSKPTPLTD